MTTRSQVTTNANHPTLKKLNVHQRQQSPGPPKPVNRKTTACRLAKSRARTPPGTLTGQPGTIKLKKQKAHQCQQSPKASKPTTR
ncbi:hypothetical protein DIPPA_07855 [Diplonema papillatum]|nr:hypothetical protein DIPPA_07855 [Diplonema papillatum]